MFKSLPGFREFYPEDCAIRNHFFRLWREQALRFGFDEYDAPLLEPLELFTEKSGEEIRQQLFEFVDKGGRAVALRPEMTPSLARLIGARANSLKRPVKWFSIGEQFRYERQQKGRLRSFYQFNADIFGEPGPAADVECIALLVQSLRAFGLSAEHFCLRVSDRDLWLLYLEAMGLTGEAAVGVLAVVDKLERDSAEVLAGRLKPFFGEAAADFLEKIRQLTQLRTVDELEAFLSGHLVNAEHKATLVRRMADWRELVGGLEAMGLSDFLRIDLGIVRGLAYYTGFVFEAFQTVGQGRALAGGGRYDALVKKLGGPDMPAVGFAIGDVTLSDLLELVDLLPHYISKPDVVVIYTGENEKRFALNDVARLRQTGWRVDYSFKSASLAKQMKGASASGARYALIYGESECAEDKVTVRDLVGREEQVVERSRLLAYLSQTT